MASLIVLLFAFSRIFLFVLNIKAMPD